ncbi:P1 family peptidase [Acuticoccus sp. I52.16.1]|uniref:P1 family peptidase n=1 Tax=Acuticoccus sp. I52.16.1 TaxID=2928472 RepID=UPI001FD21781|nr:P1 family peptidase [Acuticoccus sp. I52.16.1]UOM34600.1 P1 family peptidase [Acuticoccus sp. I52.16.1]
MSHILDVPGLRLGHASDAARRTGVTTAVFDQPATAAVAVHGGAPGTRETDALDPARLGPGVDAIVLTGGSAFGLAAADGAMLALAEMGRGFAVREHRVPIVPAAVIFDLSGERPDYRTLGEASVAAAFAAPDRTLGTIGAGINAMTAGLKGGFGAASARVGGGTVAACVVANAVGSAVAADGPWFRAAPFEVDGEFGGLGAPREADFATVTTKLGAAMRTNTTIALVATDLALTRGEAHRLAVAAHDGIALAVWPAHTIMDGDTVFAASTGRAPAPASLAETVALHAAATRCLARAIAIAVHAASPRPGDRFPTWRERFG